MSKTTGKRKASDAAESASKRACSEPVEVENLWPEGDVILLVEEPVSSKLRVSSDILSRTSSTFEAMFNGSWREGQISRSPKNPVEVHLKGDTSTGMRDMCALLHHDMGIIHNLAWSTARLQALAIAIFKYDCVGELQLQTQALMAHYLDTNKYPDSMQETAAITISAYLLNDGRTFNAITSRMMLRFSMSFFGLRKYDEDSRLPETVLFALEKKREKARHRITHGLLDLGMPRCNANDDEEHDNYDGEYVNILRELFHEPHWPPNFNDTSVRSVIERLRSDLFWDFPLSRMNVSCSHTRVREVTSDMLRLFSEEVEQDCTGLCLVCTKAQVWDLSKPCREHRQDACLDPMSLPVRKEWR